MSGTSDEHANPRTRAGEPRTICTYLAAALHMEDQISRGVYEDYTNRENWPAELDEATFLQIREHLTILIEDTKKHAQILQALADEYGQSKPSR